MGSATAICTDKTGTLTQNKMSVSRVWAAGRSFGPLPLECVEGSRDLECLGDFLDVSVSSSFTVGGGEDGYEEEDLEGDSSSGGGSVDPNLSCGMMLASEADPDATFDPNGAPYYYDEYDSYDSCDVDEELIARSGGGGGGGAFFIGGGGAHVARRLWQEGHPFSHHIGIRA